MLLGDLNASQKKKTGISLKDFTVGKIDIEHSKGCSSPDGWRFHPTDKIRKPPRGIQGLLFGHLKQDFTFVTTPYATLEADREEVIGIYGYKGAGDQPITNIGFILKEKIYQ